MSSCICSVIGKAIGLPDQFLTMPSHTIDKRFDDFEDPQNQNADEALNLNGNMIPKSLGGGVLQVGSGLHLHTDDEPFPMKVFLFSGISQRMRFRLHDSSSCSSN